MFVNEGLTIGVSAHGNHQITKHCLNSIFGSLDGNFELILVDDCSPDNGEIFQLFLEAADRHKNTKIFRFSENLEYSGSLNCILSHANGEKILFISNDIFVSKPYIQALVEISKSCKDCGVVRGVSNYVDNGLPSHNLRVSRELKHFDEIPSFAQNLYENGPLDFFEEDYLTGDAFLVTREVLQNIGYLDPLFFGYFADHDFGIRVRRAGYKLCVAKHAFAYHYQDANFDYLPEQARKKKFDARWAKIYENWARFKLKYELPVGLQYPGMNNINWSLLSNPTKGQVLHIESVDYSRFLANPIA